MAIVNRNTMSVSGLNTTNASLTAIPAPAQQSIAKTTDKYGTIFLIPFSCVLLHALYDAAHALFDVL